MTDTASPALSDDELRETLDLLATVLASVSDRVDTQTGVMDRLVKTATEARQAAFAARSQTDPGRYGALVGETIQGKINESLGLMLRVADVLDQQTRQTRDVLEKAEKDKWDILRQVREREEKADRLKRFLLRAGLGALVLSLALGITLPRFSATNSTTCTVFGGYWLTLSSGGHACVHYQD